MSEEVNSSVVVDANEVAFLKLNGFIAIPFIKEEATDNHGSRVAWDVQGDQNAITRAMRRYYGNEKVGVKDYVIILKDTRSEMYALKSQRGQLKEGREI